MNSSRTTSTIERAAPPPATLAGVDRDRVSALIGAHFDFVWRTLRRLGLPDAAADDAAQHVFLVATRRLDEIASGAERAFLYRTATLVAANARRTHARRPERPGGDDVGGEVADPAPDPEQVTEQRQARRLLDEVLSELDDDAREVFVLFELDSMQVPEIAELLGVPEGTCSSRLRRAREQFQDAVKRLRARQAFPGRRR